MINKFWKQLKLTFLIFAFFIVFFSNTSQSKIFTPIYQSTKTNVIQCINNSNNTDFLYDKNKDIKIHVIEIEEPKLNVLQRENKINDILNSVATGTDFSLITIEQNLSLHSHYITNLYFDNNISDEDIEALYEEKLPSELTINTDPILIKEINKAPHNTKKPTTIAKTSITNKPAYFDKRPLIAIVIDDMGISKKRTKDIISIKAPITASFLTYSTKIDKQIQAAINSGHEIIAHIPMEARTVKDAAPDVLTINMNKKTLTKTFNKMLDKFKNINGVNNHMGSLFTENSASMNIVLDILKSRNMYFLDSKTSAKSVATKLAINKNMPHISRHVFIDNENNYNYITNQLDKAKQIAYKRGYSVAIGHPKSQTFLALRDWLKNNDNSNVKLVHLSTIVEKLHPKIKKSKKK